MKQFLMFAAAVASLLLCSCTSELASEESLSDHAKQDTPIKIRATVDNATRNEGEISYSNDGIYSSQHLPSEFILYVWKGTEYDPETAYIKGEKVTYNIDTNSYEFESDKYWPDSDESNTVYNIFAFAGYGDNSCQLSNIQWTKGVFLTSNNTMNTTAQKQGVRDFIYDYNTVMKGGAININFKHSMAQVNFRSKIEDSNWNVQFTGGIGVEGVREGSTFVIKYSSDSGILTWEDPSYAYPTSGKIGISTIKPSKPTDDIIDLCHNCDAQGNIIESNKNVLMVVPSSYSAWSLTNVWEGDNKTIVGSRIYVDCKITDNRDNKVLYNGKLFIPIAHNWKAGHKYTYTLVWGADGIGATNEEGNPILTKLKMNVLSTENFSEVESTDKKDVNVPLE